MREMLLQKLILLLHKKGFTVSTFIHSNICFDLIARNRPITLLIKVYSNIDAIRPEQGSELKKLGDVLNAIPVIIGEKTKVFYLKDNTVYERYDIPVLTLGSFRQLLDKKIPTVRYFKGRDIVEIDSCKLREQRKKLGLTLEEIAEKLGSSIESIHRYEKGASTSLRTAERLEKILNTDIIKEIDLFDKERGTGKIYDEELHDSALEKVRELGLKLAVFEHAPFKAYSHPKESLLIQKGERKQEIRRKALELKKTRTVFDSDSMIIAKGYKYKSVEDIPVIEEQELDSLSKYKELVRIIREREKR